MTYDAVDTSCVEAAVISEPDPTHSVHEHTEEEKEEEEEEEEEEEDNASAPDEEGLLPSYDCVVLGTGLTESIVACALAKAGMYVYVWGEGMDACGCMRVCPVRHVGSATSLLISFFLPSFLPSLPPPPHPSPLSLQANLCSTWTATASMVARYV